MITRSLAGWQSQYDRMHRTYARLSKHYVSSIDYDDDLVHFFQDCWHLKDWIKHDNNVAEGVREKIEIEVKGPTSLLIAADLANGWKHLALTKPMRVGADVVSKSVTIGLKGAETHHTVRLTDGTVLSVQDVARDACRAWDVILRRIGLI